MLLEVQLCAVGCCLGALVTQISEISKKKFVRQVKRKLVLQIGKYLSLWRGGAAVEKSSCCTDWGESAQTVTDSSSL